MGRWAEEGAWETSVPSTQLTCNSRPPAGLGQQWGGGGWGGPVHAEAPLRSRDFWTCQPSHSRQEQASLVPGLAQGQTVCQAGVNASPPKDAHALIPGAREHVPLEEPQGCEEGPQVGRRTWATCWARCRRKRPHKKEPYRKVRVRKGGVTTKTERDWKRLLPGFEDGGRGLTPRNAGAPQAGHGRDTAPPLEPLGEPPGRLRPRNSERARLRGLEPGALRLGVGAATGDPCTQPGWAGMLGVGLLLQLLPGALSRAFHPGLRGWELVWFPRTNFPPMECSSVTGNTHKTMYTMTGTN